MNTRHIWMMAAMSLALAACGTNASDEEQEEQPSDGTATLTQAQIDAVSITTGSMEQRDMNGALRASGELQLNPQDKADVSSLVGGIVRRIVVTEGQTVSAGQPLAYIENTSLLEIQKDYLSASREATFANQEYERQKSLRAADAGVEKNLQKALADKEIADARKTGLAQQLRQLNIQADQVERGQFADQVPVTSPIGGIVEKIRVNTGSYVDMQTVMASVVNNRAVFCDLHVFEKDMDQVKVGQEIGVTFTNRAGLNLTAQVYEINPIIDADSKTISVHARINGKTDAILVPGMYIVGTISTGVHRANVLPDGAVSAIDGVPHVFMLDGTEQDGETTVYNFKGIEVQTGDSEGGYTEVMLPDGTDTGATFVTSGAFYIASMLSDHGEE